jgi:predicted ferric reductase
MIVAWRFFLVSIGIFSFMKMNASKMCKNENPRTKIKNHAKQKASVQIKTSGDNTLNINNVVSGLSSAFSRYDAGLVNLQWV